MTDDRSAFAPYPPGYPPRGQEARNYPPPGYPPPGYPAPGQPFAGRPPAVAPDGRPLAGAGDRFLANMIDNILSTVVVVVLMVLTLMVAAALPDDTFLRGASVTLDEPKTLLQALAGVTVVLTFVAILFGVPYLNVVWYAFRHGGQTVGKRALKIAIAGLEPGVPLRRRALVKRWLATSLAGVLSVVYIGALDSLWLLWDRPYRQALHDKVARTVVVKL